MQKEMIPFDQLVPGWEADPPLNVRKTDVLADIDELKASLLTLGQLYPFIVKHQKVGKKSVSYVVDGGRRVLAWRSIMEADKAIDEKSPMECLVLAEGEDAREVSLATSETPLPPHTADVVEMFASLHASGKSPEEIAKRMGFTDIAVRRLLALGVLSPKILAAWRAGKIDVEAARAYTLTADHAAQEKLLKKCGDAAWQVRRELGADRNAARLLAFAGAEYEEAGGTVTTDLFGDDHIVNDEGLLQKVVNEKLKAKIDALTADGWGWACQRSELPPSIQYSVYPARDAKGAKTPKEKRGNLGCLVELDHDGKFRIEYGLEKPQQRKATEKKARAGGDAAEPAPDISNALMQRLSETATLGMQDVFRKLPNVGVAALIAGAAVQGNGGAFASSPLALTIRGYKPGVNADHPEEREDLGFEEVFRAALDATDKTLLQMVADVAARCLDLRVYNAGRKPFRDEKGEYNTAGLVAGVVDDVDIAPAMLAHFDAADYFKSASKKVVLRAIEGRLGPEQARTAAKLKSAQLAEFALTNLPDWLPPELTPGAAVETAPKPERPAKKAIAKDGLSRKPAKKTAKRSR